MEFSRHTWYCCLLIIAAVVGLLLMPDHSTPTTPTRPPPAQATTATERAQQRIAQAMARSDEARRASQVQYHPPPRPVLSVGELAQHAWLHAKQEVTSVLLTPAVATFHRDSGRYVSLGETSWLISGTVDSQNAFGAMLRQLWMVRIHYRCAPDKAVVSQNACWYVESVNLGNQTWTRPPLPDPRKPAIIDAQQRLTTLGYKTGGADGIVGPATKTALQAFLADQKLPPVTGDLTTALLDAVPAMQQNTQKRSTP